MVMANNYVLSARNVSKGEFGSNPGPVKHLEVPSQAQVFRPDQAISRKDWIERVLRGARRDPAASVPAGDIVVYVHGFNSSPRLVLKRHRQVSAGLAEAGFDGIVVTFDWPSADSAFNYQEDRRDARATADHLVDDVIRPIVERQRPDCRINVHIVAHSMGAYVVREAFDYADQVLQLRAKAWTISQMVFLAADVSVRSMGVENGKSDSLYRRCVRLTNYYNPLDDVLALANTKTADAEPRAGRSGLSPTAPAKAVDVYCGARYGRIKDGIPQGASMSHAWHFDDPLFFRDLIQTIEGRIDRREFTTRTSTDRGGIALRPE
jgi:pimeloyl-ACP methyl ester carboxylesterase